MKVKRKATSNKIKARENALPTFCDQFPAISYRYITTNKRYRIDNKDGKLAYILHNRLIEIMQNDWKYWHTQNKKRGLETINYSEINFSPCNYTLTGDEKIIVFRFDGDDKRILGFKKNNCPILYIIGFDLNYSAYNHGS